MESNAILEAVNSIIFGSHGVWFLIGAALVYFMQAGFAMCEAGFTRAKNVGNIIMKNLMDFCLEQLLSSLSVTIFFVVMLQNSGAVLQ